MPTDKVLLISLAAVKAALPNMLLAELTVSMSGTGLPSLTCLDKSSGMYRPTRALPLFKSSTISSDRVTWSTSWNFSASL